VDTVIERLSNDGAGVGRHPDGRVLFVAGTAPGDHVRVRIIEAQRRLLRGEVEELLTPGPGRVEPRCPLVDRCGGCSWQHVDYETQLAAKADIVADALRRIAKLDLEDPVEMVPSPSPYEYRSRARLLVRGGRPGFRAAASRDHVPVDDCPVLAAPLRAALAELAAATRANGEWELALGEPSAAWPDGVRCAPLAEGAEDLELSAGGARVRIVAGGFAQANALLLAALVDAVCAAAGRGAALLELYAGAGFLTLPLARAFERVLAVEAVAPAVERLRSAALEAGLRHVEARAEDAGRFAESPALTAFAPDVVCVDPPRAGLAPEVVTALCRPGPRRLIYLSCDPATLARDLADLHAGRWRVASLCAFDLFPQTPHVETLVRLERGTP
jgi:23S rRNA (uracil1939-C5)-methyltransferase